MTIPIELGIGMWIVLSFVVGLAASRKHRSGAAWTILSFAISPILAGFALMMLGENPKYDPKKWGY